MKGWKQVQLVSLVSGLQLRPCRSQLGQQQHGVAMGESPIWSPCVVHAGLAATAQGLSSGKGLAHKENENPEKQRALAPESWLKNEGTAWTNKRNRL